MRRDRRRWGPRIGGAGVGEVAKQDTYMTEDVGGGVKIRRRVRAGTEVPAHYQAEGAAPARPEPESPAPPAPDAGVSPTPPAAPAAPASAPTPRPAPPRRRGGGKPKADG